MKINIRKASTEDAVLINSMAAIVFEATYKKILSSDQLEYMFDRMYSVPNILKQIGNGHQYFLAYHGDKEFQEIGYCGYASVERKDKSLFHLQKIYVMPGYQGKNIGKLLFMEVIGFIRSVHPGESVMELNVNRANNAVGFYKRLGMEIDRRGDFPIGNGYFMNDYIMKLRINDDMVF